MVTPVPASGPRAVRVGSRSLQVPKDKAERDTFVEALLRYTIAEQVRVNREARNWTQRELAERCGSNQSTISRIENCRDLRLLPSLDLLQRIASAFDCALLVQFKAFGELHTFIASRVVCSYRNDPIKEPAA